MGRRMATGLPVLVVVMVGVAVGACSDSGAVEIGKPYDYTMYTHCGAQEMKFDDRYWRAAPVGAPPANAPFDWADPQQPGTVTLISESEAVFEAKGSEMRFVLRPGATGFERICD